MRENALELVVQLLMLGGYGVAALIAGTIGIVIEYNSYLYAMGGEYRLAAWIGVFGLVALVFAYLIVTDKFLPSLQSSFSSESP